MIVKLLTEHHLEYLSLTGGCIGSSESTLVKMPHCLKSHVTVHFTSAEGEVDFEVLHVLSFDSTRKRMSVIVRHPLTKEIILYTKGADSAILSVLAKKYKGKVIVRHSTLKKLSCTLKVLTWQFSVCLPKNIKVRS